MYSTDKMYVAELRAHVMILYTHAVYFSPLSITKRRFDNTNNPPPTNKKHFPPFYRWAIFF